MRNLIGGVTTRAGAWAFAALALAAVSIPERAVAQEWPTHPMTMVVAAAAGGPIDVFGRVLAERLSVLLGQPVLVDNIGGSGGMVGAQHVARADPDGYTFILGTSATHTCAPLLYRKPLYDPIKDFTPVGLIAEIPLVLITRKNFPAATMEEFAAYTRANASKLNYGSAGAGSATHLGCILLDNALGVNVMHVPYKGTGPAMMDLQAGQIDYVCEIILTAAPQIQAGAVKGIAVLSRDRSPMLPDLPTAFEKGFTDVQAYTWTALFLPKGAPDAIARKLHDATIKAIDDPATRDRLAGLGATMVSSDRRSSAYLGDFVKSELDKWRGPINASGAVGD
jgi:tripartite-type tricarboxylate transporter receptor subunit TctC